MSSHAPSSTALRMNESLRGIFDRLSLQIICLEYKARSNSDTRASMCHCRMDLLAMSVMPEFATIEIHEMISNATSSTIHIYPYWQIPPWVATTNLEEALDSYTFRQTIISTKIMPSAHPSCENMENSSDPSVPRSVPLDDQMKL